MDPNLKPAIGAIDPSVSSLTSSLVQLEINLHSTSVGPINLLPSEMMQLILAKLGLDIDVKKLLRLRLVSTKWRAMVEDYCGQKKSLIVRQNNKFYDALVGTSFTIDSHEERTRVSDFVVYINSLASLKQLDLDGPFVPALSSLSATLSNLEHFSFDFPFSLYISRSSLKDDDHHQLISHLGSSCVRVKFNYSVRFVCDQILQWHNINSAWLVNLTHLQIICIDCSSELKLVQVVQFLSEHAPMKLLSFEAVPKLNSLHLTQTVIHNLGKLTNLAELQLKNIKMDFFELQHTVPLTSLSTVVSTKLVVHYSDQRYRLSGDLCTRVLSAIFPNLIDLELTIQFYYAPEILSQHEIQQHLDRFPNLRKHKIDVGYLL